MPETAIEQHQAFAGVIDILEAIGIDYVIWGGLLLWPTVSLASLTTWTS